MQKIAGVSFVAMSLRGGAALLTFAASVIIARYLGVEDAGYYYLALTIIYIVATLSRIGLDDVIVRQVALNRERDNQIAISQFMDHSFRRVVVVAVLAGVLLFTLSPLLSRYLPSLPHISEAVRFFSFAVLPMALIVVVARFLQGIKCFLSAVLVETTVLPLANVLLLPLLIPKWGLLGAISAYLVASAISLGLALVLLSRRYTFKAVAQEAQYDRTAVDSSRSTMLKVTVLNLAVAWSATLILAATSSAAEMGVYQVAYRTSLMLTLVLVAVNGIVAPQIAASHGNGDTAMMTKTIRHANYLIIFTAFPAVLLLLLFPGWAMSLFGKEFAAAGSVLFVLVFGQLVNLISGPVGQVLAMTGYERQLQRAYVFAFVVGTIVGILFIPRYGAIAAAASTAASVFTVNVIAFVAMVRYLELKPLALFVPGRLQ